MTAHSGQEPTLKVERRSPPGAGKAMVVTFNGRPVSMRSVKELEMALDQFDRTPVFELVCSSEGDGPVLFMLRNSQWAWLLYMTEPGDAGLHSEGDASLSGTTSYILSNGQVDEYPLAWCIPVSDCYKAVTYFYAHEGARPAVNWRES